MFAYFCLSVTALGKVIFVYEFLLTQQMSFMMINDDTVYSAISSEHFSTKIPVNYIKQSFFKVEFKIT